MHSATPSTYKTYFQFLASKLFAVARREYVLLFGRCYYGFGNNPSFNAELFSQAENSVHTFVDC
jgi:hypothetical protein